MHFQGWYIVTYALGIYHLNLFIAFLTPKIDPAMDFDGKHFTRSISIYFFMQLLLKLYIYCKKIV